MAYPNADKAKPYAYCYTCDNERNVELKNGHFHCVKCSELVEKAHVVNANV